MSIKEIFEIELKFDDTAINIPRVVRQFEELEESERQRLGYVQRLDIAYKRLGVAVKQAQNPTDAAKYAAEQRNIRTQINSITKASQTQLGIINRLKAEQKELTGLRDSSEDTTQIRKYNTQLKNTREELRKIRETQSPANFLFEQNFKANAAALGLQFAVNGFRDLKTEVIEFGKEAIIVTKDYDRLVKTLGAVSRAAPDDLKSLDTNARALGRSTQFTADQVAGLQLEFARLGFTPAKILASTADSLNLAAVSGGELNQVAKLVGATLNAFQLESTEAGRVTDVLSLALSSSAFNFGTLQTALSISAPIASQANVSLEKTTALLGVLVDVGIDASTAGTSLRNIFIKLSTQGLTLEQALEKINTSTDKNKTAFELFGTRGATTASVLASTIPKWQRLNRELEASAGFAKQAGDAITDDLQGDFDRASAAVEGLQINLTNLVKGGIRDLTQGFTSVTNSISDFLEVPLSEELLREESAIIGLVGAINTLEGDRESQIEILNEIKRINPDIVAGYSNEDDAIKGLLPRLRQYISLNQERVAVASQQGRVDIEQSNLDESLERINRARRIASKRINNALRDADLPLIGEGVFSDESLEQAFQRFRDTGQRFARFGETLKLAQLADSDVDISALTKEQNELLKVQKQKRQAQLEFDEQILNTSQESLLNLKSELETSEQRNASEAVLSTLKSQISAQESIVEEKRISVGKRVLENLDSEIALLKTRSAIKLPENATPQDVTEAQAKQIENEKELNRLIKDRFDLANSLGVSAPVNLSQDELDEIRKNQLEQSALEKSAAEATAKATKEAEAERKRIAKKKAADEERERKRRLSEQKKFNDQINKLQFEADNLSAPLSVSDSELGKAEEQIGKSVDRITRRISEVKRKINESVDLDAAQKSKFISDLNDVLDKQETFIRAQGDIKLRNVLIKIVTDVEVENAELNLNEAREKLEDEFDIIEFETEQSKNTISQFFSELRDDINNTSLLSTETRTEFIDQLLLLEKEQNEILERQRAQRNQDVRDTAVFEVETNVREDFRLTSSFSDIDKEEADAIVRLNEQRRKELISYEDYEKNLNNLQNIYAVRRLEVEKAITEGTIAEITKRLGGLSEDEFILATQRIKELEARLTELNGEISGVNLPEEDDNEGSGANFEKAIETTKQVTDFVIEQYKARLEAEKEYIDASISLQENRVDRAIEIAKLGNSEYLDEEQSRLQKLEREREQSQRRQENVARAQILINLLLGVSRAFADGGNASGATSGIGSILSNLGSIIPSFYKGTERTLGDESSPMFAGRDGHLIFADSSEMIFNGSQVSDLQSVFGRNVTTNQITDYVTSSATNKTNYVTTTTKDIQYEKLISELQVMPRINYEGIIRNVGALQVANYTTNTSNSDNRKIEELLATLIETTKKGQRAQKSGRSFGERWRNG